MKNKNISKKIFSLFLSTIFLCTSLWINNNAIAWMIDFNQEKYDKLVSDYWFNNTDNTQWNYLDSFITWDKIWQLNINTNSILLYSANWKTTEQLNTDKTNLENTIQTIINWESLLQTISSYMKPAECETVSCNLSSPWWIWYLWLAPNSEEFTTEWIYYVHSRFNDKYSELKSKLDNLKNTISSKISNIENIIYIKSLKNSLITISEDLEWLKTDSWSIITFNVWMISMSNWEIRLAADIPDSAEYSYKIEWWYWEPYTSATIFIKKYPWLYSSANAWKKITFAAKDSNNNVTYITSKLWKDVFDFNNLCGNWIIDFFEKSDNWQTCVQYDPCWPWKYLSWSKTCVDAWVGKYQPNEYAYESVNPTPWYYVTWWTSATTRTWQSQCLAWTYCVSWDQKTPSTWYYTTTNWATTQTKASAWYYARSDNKWQTACWWYTKYSAWWTDSCSTVSSWYYSTWWWSTTRTWQAAAQVWKYASSWVQNNCRSWSYQPNTWKTSCVAIPSGYECDAWNWGCYSIKQSIILNEITAWCSTIINLWWLKVCWADSKLNPQWTFWSYPWYYDWNHRNNACPTWYHVPSDWEWGTVLSASWWNYVTLRANLGLQLSGYRDTNGNFHTQGSYGSYWSSTESSSTYARYQRFDTSWGNRTYHDKDIGFSVRCFKD